MHVANACASLIDVASSTGLSFVRRLPRRDPIGGSAAAIPPTHHRPIAEASSATRNFMEFPLFRQAYSAACKGDFKPRTAARSDSRPLERFGFIADRCLDQLIIK